MKIFIKSGHFKRKMVKNMEKQPTLADHCESSSETTVLIQASGFFKGNSLVINRKAGRSAIYSQSLVKSCGFFGKLGGLVQPEQKEGTTTPRSLAVLIDADSGTQWRMQDVDLYLMLKLTLVEEIFNVKVEASCGHDGHIAMAAMTLVSEKTPPGCKSGSPREKRHNFSSWCDILNLRRVLASWAAGTPIGVATSIGSSLNRTWWSREVAKTRVGTG